MVSMLCRLPHTACWIFAESLRNSCVRRYANLHNLPLTKTCGVRALVVALISALRVLLIPVAAADPPQGAHITDIQHVTDRWDKVSVFSPSMKTVIVNDVFNAPNASAPVFYLLPGIDGGNDLDPGGAVPASGKAWFGMTDIPGFFANKNVNVVSPHRRCV
jgi:diacylglycerol O-acyltransferase / trehalose O-mycolyltransferase